MTRTHPDFAALSPKALLDEDLVIGTMNVPADRIGIMRIAEVFAR
jgi:hypothetical protein